MMTIRTMHDETDDDDENNYDDILTIFLSKATQKED